MKRRNFIKITMGATGGLVLSLSVLSAYQKFDGKGGKLSVFIYVTPDSKVMINIPIPEIGQGIRTSLAMLIADEMGAGWASVTIEQMEPDKKINIRQRAAGSASIRDTWIPLRTAGATVRELLKMAAASKYPSMKEDWICKEGFVVNSQTNKQIPFGQLAELASSFDPPTNVHLKERSQFNLIGKSIVSKDIQYIVNGKARFGVDVKLDGMVYASIERCPVFAGRVVSFDDTEARKVHGYKSTIEIQPVGADNYPNVQSGVAVVATSTWAAMQARKLLRINWKFGQNQEENSEQLHQAGRSMISKPQTVVRNDGSWEKSSGDIELASTYHLPFITHLPMETLNSTAHFNNGAVTIWSTTQMPLALKATVARIFKINEEKIVIRSMRIGGAFGRRLGFDADLEACFIAKNLDVPVQILWTREDDVKQGYYRPFSYHLLAAKLNSSNKSISAWLHRQCGTSRYAFRTGVTPDQSEFFTNNFPANLIPNYRLEYGLIQSGLPRALIRAPGNNALSFVTESFIDEICYRLRVDPLDFRMTLYGEDQEFLFEEEDGEKIFINTERMRKVLMAATDKAGWRHKKGRNLGIACHYTFQSYVAHIAEVEYNKKRNEIKVVKFTSAIDCGIPVNPNGIKSQVQGAIIDGLAATIYGEITFKDGKVQQGNFNDYQWLRLAQSPDEIDVVVVDSDLSPTGVGEPPYPPVAPALCNAIFRATNVRIRSLPIKGFKFV